MKQTRRVRVSHAVCVSRCDVNELIMQDAKESEGGSARATEGELVLLYVSCGHQAVLGYQAAFPAENIMLYFFLTFDRDPVGRTVSCRWSLYGNAACCGGRAPAAHGGKQSQRRWTQPLLGPGAGQSPASRVATPAQGRQRPQPQAPPGLETNDLGRMFGPWARLFTFKVPAGIRSDTSAKGGWRPPVTCRRRQCEGDGDESERNQVVGGGVAHRIISSLRDFVLVVVFASLLT